MEWIKKNMVFVVSCAVALVAIGAAGYYLSVQMAKYNAAGTDLASIDTAIGGLVTKNPHPGAGNVDNIKAAKDDIQRLEQFKKDLTGTFKSTPLGGVTEQAFKAELAETLAYIQKEGKRAGLTTHSNFALSFTAQKVSFRFASNSLPALRVQLADLREVTRILVDARVNTIEAYRRVAVSADDAGQNALEEDYIKNLKITTNEFTGAIMHPYEVVFRCFSEELGNVLEEISHSPYSIILKTVSVEPGTVRNIKPLFASAESVFGGSLPGGPPGARSPYGGGGPGGGGSPYGRGGPGGAGGKDSPYGGGGPGGTARGAARSDPRMSSVYGGAGGARPGGPAAPVPNGPPGTGPGPGQLVPAQPAGPEVILSEEPLKVTLGLAVIRMPEAQAVPATPAAKPTKPATN